ncbi:MBL fold metallo-hydrolase [Halogeometricum borinquense]|uniref:MBL fold metallo-hydrolase n=1 Tax=Halogeometricum borinquense TaxID=60847 RepID=A0A6C0UND2_9EURY|nr:MBL fold metallo-hydrolase [Halogeometricum borinquense]QIB76093.1 MBL fold metallo-hydrolase [Halogeometricum borinquense]
MITHGNTTVVLDIGPDIGEQLIKTRTKSVDAFFVTHAHDDHISGILDLHKVSAFADIPVTVFAEQTVWSYIDDVFPWVEVNRCDVSPQDQVSVGPLTVEPFRIEHSEQFPEVGYSITDGQATAVYAPDVYSIKARIA